MARDVQLGTNRMSQYASKLTQRAQALFYLNKHEDAIADIKRSLEMKLAHSEAPDQNKTMAYFKCGKTFLDWHRHRQLGLDEAKLLFKEAAVCFRQAEKEMRSQGSACLTGRDKSDFIRLYKQIAKNVKRRESKRINDFCERYEKGVTINSSSSSSSDSDEASNADDDFSIVIYSRN